MDRDLGRFIISRLDEATVALDKIEMRAIELRIALRTCDDESVRARLEEKLMLLARRMLSVAAVVQPNLRSD